MNSSIFLLFHVKFCCMDCLAAHVCICLPNTSKLRKICQPQEFQRPMLGKLYSILSVFLTISGPHISVYHCHGDTPPKFNIAPERLPKLKRKVVFPPSIFRGELFVKLQVGKCWEIIKQALKNKQTPSKLPNKKTLVRGHHGFFLSSNRICKQKRLKKTRNNRM